MMTYVVCCMLSGVSDLKIRLVDGDDDLSGRVEVRRGGEWGTICKERFDDEDATVICRSLGFTYVFTRTTLNKFVKKHRNQRGF